MSLKVSTKRFKIPNAEKKSSPIRKLWQFLTLTLNLMRKLPLTIARRSHSCTCFAEFDIPLAAPQHRPAPPVPIAPLDTSVLKIRVKICWKVRMTQFISKLFCGEVWISCAPKSWQIRVHMKIIVTIKDSYTSAYDLY